MASSILTIIRGIDNCSNDKSARTVENELFSFLKTSPTSSRSPHALPCLVSLDDVRFIGTKTESKSSSVRSPWARGMGTQCPVCLPAVAAESEASVDTTRCSFGLMWREMLSKPAGRKVRSKLSHILFSEPEHCPTSPQLITPTFSCSCSAVFSFTVFDRIIFEGCLCLTTFCYYHCHKYLFSYHHTFIKMRVRIWTYKKKIAAVTARQRP